MDGEKKPSGDMVKVRMAERGGRGDYRRIGILLDKVAVFQRKIGKCSRFCRLLSFGLFKGLSSSQGWADDPESQLSSVRL
jgi:hypothetical protein